MNKKLQTVDSLKALLKACAFGEWDIDLKFDGERPYVQLSFMDTDEFTGLLERQHCRKYTLSYEMCDTEVVRTVFIAIKQAMTHEIEEKFMYKGRRIFNPHRSVDALLQISDGTHVDIRQPLPQSEEI